AFTWLRSGSTSEERVDALRTLLLDEHDVMVGTALLVCLQREAHTSPDAVDSLLAELDDRRGVDDGFSETRDDCVEAEPADDERAAKERDKLAVNITTFLGLHHEAPYSSSALKEWADAAPVSKELSHAISFIRDYFAPGAEIGVQKRAFEFATAGCTSALACLDEMSAALTGKTEATPDEIASLKRAYNVLDTTASQIYFSSGAYDRKSTAVEDGTTQHAPATAELARLADLAIPLLLLCASSKAAPVIHHVVETLVFLSRVDERRGLQALADAVAANDGYAYDSLAAGVVIPHLTRLLAEERNLVLYDEQGVTAFRKLLSAFAGAGNEKALVLAFTFSDVFR
ncbi:hypothetical protein, partial [Nocardioides sp. GCM10030258]|uniref:hypothetical protein n=1 Tax=unclassified Nocardioides TaxID=2615069 RepID=UPI003611E7E3